MVEKAKIGNGIYDVVDPDQYIRNPSAYTNFSAVKDGNYVYPVRNKMDNRPGLYNIGPIIEFQDPQTEEDKAMYSISNVINFSDSKSLKEVIEKQDMINKAERSILTTVDNIFVCEEGPNDTPHMLALKQAINAKQVDLDKYEKRFGANYNNDRRLLKTTDITMNKLRSFLDKMDLKASLTIEDKSGDVPNPMGRVINVDLNTATDDDGGAEEI